MPSEDRAARRGALDPERFEALAAAGRELVSELDLDALLERLLETGRELTGAGAAALGIVDSGGRGYARFLPADVDAETRRRIAELPPPSGAQPDRDPSPSALLAVPVVAGGEHYATLHLAAKAGGAEFDSADRRAAGALADWAAIAISNARRYTEATRRGGELERAVRGLEATTEIARAVGGETDLARVLETIAHRARALVEARSVIIVLADRGDLEVAITAGEVDPQVIGERLPMDSVWARVAREGHPERFGGRGGGLPFDPAELGSRAEAALLVPLIFRGRALGLVAVFDRLRHGPGFDDDDESLLLSFAASAATAVATAQSVAEDRVRFSIEASERERSRWARELHDETLQSLGALRVTLSSALRGGGRRLEQAVELSIAQLADEIANLRSLIAELRPGTLDELGLAVALESLVEHHAATRGLEIDSRIELGDEDGARRLDPEIESSVYRVVQEGLTNIGKHSRAEQVELAVTADRRRISIRIRDDGVGFDTSRAVDGFGLRGMRERAALVDGTMSVASVPGSGTELAIEIPASFRPRPRLSYAR